MEAKPQSEIQSNKTLSDSGTIIIYNLCWSAFCPIPI